MHGGGVRGGEAYVVGACVVGGMHGRGGCACHAHPPRQIL